MPCIRNARQCSIADKVIVSDGESREKLLKKIEALLSKTVANGCTPGEARLALEKAQELMARYKQIYESEEAVQQTTPSKSRYDIHAILREIEQEIAYWLAVLDEASNRRADVEIRLRPVVDEIERLNDLICASYCRDKNGVFETAGEWQMTKSQIMVAHWIIDGSEFAAYQEIERMVLKPDEDNRALRRALFKEQINLLDDEDVNEAFEE